MIKTIRYCCQVGLVTAVLTSPEASFGRESNQADVAYGAGVQAFFSGNSAEAQRHLADAIQNNPDDPRPYYFRGLSLLRMGQTAEAREELAAGARFEAQRPGRYPVGRSLERVQGRDRLLLEDFRRQARADVSSLQNERQRTRYEQHAGGDAGVLRQQVAVPLQDLIEPSQLPQWTRSSAAVVSPQETAAAQESMDRDAAIAGATGAAGADSAGDDPFADDAESSAIADAQVADPFAVDTTDDQPFAADTTAGGQGIPPEKMLGIVGRVLRRAAPLPSLEGIGRNVPFWPGGELNGNSFDDVRDSTPEGSPAMPTDGGGPFDFGPPGPPPSTESDAGDDEPFGSSLDQPDASSDENGSPGTTPSEPPDEDPFGGF
jgi:hypothetical protein